MTGAMWWTIAGLVASLLGVIILFLFGMPFRVRTRGLDSIYGDRVDEAAIQLEALYDKFGWLGVFLAVLGTTAQAYGAWLSAH
jgi:drug/metabolite transporter (DMT)-like permease